LCARRLAAALVDVLLALALALALAPTLGRWFAARSVPTFRIGEPDTLWRGPVPLVLALLGPLVYGVPFAAWIVRLAEPLFGASPGQRLLGLEVRSARGGPAAAGARVRRFLFATAPWGLATLALAAGRWEVMAAAGVAALAVAVGWVGVIVSGGGRGLPDRAAGTRLARRERPLSGVDGA